MCLASVQRFQLVKPIEIQQRESGVGDRAEIAAAALHRKHPDRLSGERIRQVDFGAGIAASEVGNAEVGPEEVGSIPQQRQRTAGERVRLPLIPEVLQADQACGIRHR